MRSAPVPGSACCGNSWQEWSRSDIAVLSGIRSALVEITVHPDADIVMQEFLPRQAVRQPSWSHEPMAQYWLAAQRPK